MLGRIVILVATAAIGGGALLGRRVINRRIEGKLPTEIEIARATALVELDKEISQVVRERLISFAINLAIKAGLVGAAYLMYDFGLLSSDGFRFVAFGLIGLFILYDVSKTLPFVLPALRHVRKHRWKLRTAFVEFVAGVAFERAYARAMIATETGPNRFFLSLSKYSAHAISSEVGEAVAEVARSVSVARAKWRALIGAAIAVMMFSAYSVFFVSLVKAGNL